MLRPTHPEPRVTQCWIYQPRPLTAVIAGEPTPRAADPRVDATLATAGAGVPHKSGPSLHAVLDIRGLYCTVAQKGAQNGERLTVAGKIKPATHWRSGL